MTTRMTEPQHVALHFASAALMTAAAAILLWVRGPLPISYADWASPHRPSFFYMVLAFPLFGSVCAEFLARWHSGAVDRRLAMQLAALCALALARLTTGFPVSGHVMLAVFYVIFARGLRGPVRGLALIGGWLTLIWFLYVKLHLWGDFVTPATGALAGLIVGLVPSTRLKSRRS